MPAMRKFRILLKGENFLMEFESAPKRLGFYVVRVVEAADEADAELRAVEMLRRDPKLRGQVLNDPSDPPMLFAEEIAETEADDEYETSPPGFIFYDASDDPTK